MDDDKRKNELLKNTVQNYLKKRNYPLIKLEKSTINQELLYNLIEKETSTPNSILYSCHNIDLNIINKNFDEFINWLKTILDNNSKYNDLELLVGPLFCHLYFEILRSDHTEKALNFYRRNISIVEKYKYKNEEFITKLIDNLTINSDVLNNKFRSNKYFLKLHLNTIEILKKFVLEKCHVIFLHILQTWFEFETIDKYDEINRNEEEEEEEKTKMIEEETDIEMLEKEDTNIKLNELKKIIDEIENQPKPFFTIHITNVKEIIDCALIKRTCGIICYSQLNQLHIRPIHPFDSVLGYPEVEEIRLCDHTKIIYSISISLDNSKLATGSADKDICIYDMDDIHLTNVCKGHLGPVYAVKISPNNNYLASASHDNTSRLWNITNGTTLRLFAGHSEPVTCLDFHINCLYLVTGSADKNIRLWSLESGNSLRLFHGSKGIIYSVVVNPLGELLASSSEKNQICIWEILTSKLILELKYKGQPITKLCWDKSGKELCGSAVDGTIRIWNLNNLQESEPTVFNTNKCIFNLEYSFDHFSCITGDLK